MQKIILVITILSDPKTQAEKNITFFIALGSVLLVAGLIFYFWTRHEKRKNEKGYPEVVMGILNALKEGESANHMTNLSNYIQKKGIRSHGLFTGLNSEHKIYLRFFVETEVGERECIFTEVAKKHWNIEIATPKDTPS